MSRPHLVLAACIAAVLIPCCSRSHRPVTRQSTAMNTYMSVTIYDQDISESRAQSLIDTAFSEIRRVEGFATDYADSSEVGRINAAAGRLPVRVSDELIGLIRRGLEYGKESEGKLDISIGGLVKKWNFIGEHPRALTRKEVDSILPHVDYRRVVLKGSDVYLPDPAMRLDLGSYGKGYAIDRASEKLLAAGVRQFIVDIGGKLRVQFEGSRMLDSTVARILIRHPRKEGEYLGSFVMGTGAVSTSGDYERYFLENGIRYHHLLDPATGYPARGVVAVTVVTEDAISGDAISTIAFLLGREKGMEFIRHTPGIDGMLTYADGDSLAYEITPGFARRFNGDNGK
jgi:thiamine biosynthesis lipoprotein